MYREKGAKRSRDIVVKVCLNDIEYEMLKAKCDVLGGMKISELLRYMIMNSQVVYKNDKSIHFDNNVYIKDFKSFIMLCNELNHIGVNINQIAKVINETNKVGGDYDSALIEKVKKEWEDALKLINNIVMKENE